MLFMPMDEATDTVLTKKIPGYAEIQNFSNENPSVGFLPENEDWEEKNTNIDACSSAMVQGTIATKNDSNTIVSLAKLEVDGNGSARKHLTKGLQCWIGAACTRSDNDDTGKG